jgi:chromosome segregation protein
VYLKAINLKGFKSFPDRTRLTFSPGVSVIVGPNGSGKSNITDAVLWALGEQSPSAIRGQQMRDVIFAGGSGQSPRRFAEVEVVIDNTEGRAASEFSEISISRRIERNGEGEYRLNGARCRLADIVEALSDTNMGREAHSVISQGRVEAIVNSKPRDRRLLIEEAAGLGKHRKRRHSAQLKLDRTRDNLERAMDVEREARSHLRPLKRQAEAAERTAKLVKETNELRARIVADQLRAQQSDLAEAESKLIEVRSGRDSVERRFEEVRARRTAIEERIAAGEEGRRRRSELIAEVRAATERVRARAEATEHAERELRSALGERQLRLEALDEDPGEGAALERVRELEAELAGLDQAADPEEAELREQAQGAERRMAEARGAVEPLERAAEEARDALRRATQMQERARAEAVKASERRATLAGELAAVEAKLASAAVEGDHDALAGMLEAGSGLERAVSAVLGERLRASIVGSVEEGRQRLSGAEGAARALISSNEQRAPSPPPKEGARPLLDLVEARGEAGPITERLLADAWLVDEIDGLAEGFAGVAVTVDGECYDAAAGEVRRLPREGTDPALAARSEREELASRLGQREQTEERARNDLERADRMLAEARSREDEAQRVLRDARRELDEATEEATRTTWLAERRAERGGETSGAAAIQRAKLEAELAAERRHAGAAERARQSRIRDRQELARRIALERETLPALARAQAALKSVAERLEQRAEAISTGKGDGDGEVAAELRECSQREFGLQGELREASEAMTAAEVEATQLRARRDESAAELERLGSALGETLSAATEPLSDEDREKIEARLARLERNREKIGPVNPLAEREYADAREHVTELADQRKDLEKAITELRALIRRIDQEIAAAFEETFDATARGFEEMVAALFPGGRGRLRRVDVGGPRPFAGQSVDGNQEAGAEEEDELTPPNEDGGVEIEVTPEGKSTRRLSLLSGGEKSLVALAFVFAVLMARPCPFYILDEVEAALDDINLDRFLRLVRRFAERSQFIVVTHQKRTMDAADILYGVSMGGDGVTKVVSRKLPRDDLGAGELPAETPEAEEAAA